jgi:DNA adenine methylase
MTSYHGGKQRIGKKLSEIIYNESIDIENNYEFKIKGYCEPFSGMFGVYQHIPKLFEQTHQKINYKAGDINKSVIMMWKAAQKGWKPPYTATEKQYNNLKIAKDSALKGYIGHQYSFGGQFFNGYAPKFGKNSNSLKASTNVINIAKVLKKVEITQGSYTQFSKLKGYVIYCDPPYDNTIQRYYNSNDKVGFDHVFFWEWCRMMSYNNIVFISNYNAPKDFELIFSSAHKLTGICPNKNNKKRVEKLYLLF